ncbi:hypothetical protein NC651_008885, partial [Populus alba x Populus x berolinensis]
GDTNLFGSLQIASNTSKPYPRPSVSSNTLRADAASPRSPHPLTKMMWINNHYCAAIIVVVSLKLEIKGHPHYARAITTQHQLVPYIFSSSKSWRQEHKCSDLLII